MITFLLTDVEGSTRRWEQEPAGMAAALEHHDAIIDTVVTAHRGSVIKTKGEGDSTFSVFDDPADAVAAAVAAQRRLGDESELRVRMAVHIGPAETRGGDYYGPTVNRCARLRGAAHGGQVVISDAVAELVGARLPEDVTLRDLGVHRLRDLAEPEHVWQLSHRALERDFPALASLDVRRDNLRPALTTFVGRDAELAELVQLIGDERLVTLVGPGGAGKTRLAIEVARRVGDRFPDGVWVVELAAVDDPAHVDAAVAAVLGVREQPGATLRDALADALDRSSLLLVLDNCEHVVENAALVAEVALAARSNTAVLATSRQPLQLRGEQTFPVRPLPEAAELFIERATRLDPHFRLDATTRDAVERICRAVDSLPLGIELAAARLDSLSPEEIADRLDRVADDGERYDVLSTPARNTEERQRTLANTIAWSYDLLNAAERDAFAALAVLPGSFDLGAAEAVVGARGLDAVGALVTKSLLSRVDRRYLMLETIRAFAGDKLAGSGRAGEVHDRLVRWALDAVKTDDLDGLDLDDEIIAAAVRWAAATDAGTALQIALGMVPLWRERGRWSQARSTLARLLDDGGTERRTRAQALLALAELALRQRDFNEANDRATEVLALDAAGDDVEARTRAHLVRGAAAYDLGKLVHARSEYDTALKLATGAGVSGLVVRALGQLAIIAHADGELEQADELYADAIRAARSANDELTLCSILQNAGITAESRGDIDRAFVLYDEGLAIATRRHRIGERAFLLRQIGHLAANTGDLDRAHAALEESLEIFRQLGDRANVANALYGLSDLAIEERRYDDAEKAIGEALALWREIGHPLGEAIALLSSGMLHFRRGDTGTALGCGRASLGALQRLGHREGLAEALDLIGAIAALGGDDELAATLIGAADALREAIGLIRTGERLIELSALATDQAEALQRGAAMDVDAAVALATSYGK